MLAHRDVLQRCLPHPTAVAAETRRSIAAFTGVHRAVAANQLNASARQRSGAICARVSKGGRMDVLLSLFLFIVVSSLVVSGGLLLAVWDDGPGFQGNPNSLADHELADLAHPP